MTRLAASRERALVEAEGSRGRAARHGEITSGVCVCVGVCLTKDGRARQSYIAKGR